MNDSERETTAGRRGGITLLDGGMGKELERIGAPFRQPEWSALALMDDPGWVVTAHRNFIDAGAAIITANSYAVVPFHLGDDRFAARGAELAALAGKLAREAADGADRPVLVAGSLPPLFGSYEPDRFDPERAPDLYRTLIEAQAPYVDLWLAETMSSIAEGRVVAEAVAASGSGELPYWAAYTVADELFDGRARLRSGESIVDLAEAVSASSPGADGVDAVLFNCSQPEYVTLAVEEFATTAAVIEDDLRFGAYANAFETKPEVYAANTTILGARADLTPERYRSMVDGWIAAGATIVGGCCNIRPDHIRHLADELGSKRTGS